MSDLFEPLRELPEPPLTGSAEALATARRTVRRHTALRLSAVALAVVVATSGGAVLARRLNQPPAAPLATPAASMRTQGPPRVPSAAAVGAHTRQLRDLLTAAVPAGYAAHPVNVAGGVSPYSRRGDIRPGGYRTITLVQVTRDGGAGTLGLLFGNDVPAPGVDPCATNRDLGIEGATVHGCRVVTVDGVPVRVVTGTQPGLGQVISVVRYLDGGYLLVSFSQGTRSYWIKLADGPGDVSLWEVAVNPTSERALRTMPFTADQLAALASNPAVLP